jgi:undecaprenyl-diphosphatase
VYYRNIGEILRDFVRWLIGGKMERKEIHKGGNVKLLLYILVSVAVTGIAGTLFRDTLSSFFYRPRFALLFLAITGGILLLTGFTKEGEKDIRTVTVPFPFIIGAVQAFSLLPGISRSGTTISTGLFLGAQRSFAATFSFLIAIPSVFGASIFEFIVHERAEIGIDHSILITAFVVSLIAGYLSLKLLIRFVMKGKIYLFSFYCFALSIAGLIILH